jgi:hypothetical protein
MTSYTIESNQQITQMGRGNRMVTTYEVAIRTANGSTGTLIIAEKDYNADTLKSLLDDFADKLDLPYTLAEA